jgi:hypothetical protein
MKKNTCYIAGLLMAGAFFTACKKDSGSSSTTISVSAKTVTNVNADPSATGNHYAFFSLERNEAVAASDSATNKWDIAFRSTTIITNSGTSGPGAGGAFVQTGVVFDDYAKVATDSAFRVDNIAATPAFAIPTGSGNGWYNYNTTTNVITPIPGRLIIVRTATGKYAKLEITSYYKDAPATPDATSTARYYHFRFGYQADGSKNFK